MFRILVPVDLTESSYKACNFALTFANLAPEATVVLLHCYQDYLAEPEVEDIFSTNPTPSEVITDHVLRRNQTDAQDKLDELYQHTLTRVAKDQRVQLERVFMYGMPEDLIPEEVQRFKPDLLVMATKGESNLARTFFGTISTNIAQEITVPILTIPETYEGTSIKRVLYATDFDKADTQVLEALQQLLQPFGPVIECVHVADEPSQKDNKKLEELRSALQQTATTNLTYTFLEGNDVANALQKFVSEQAIDLIALTTRSRTLLGSLLNPSLTKRMVLESQVPLLIFHSSDKV
ncbi:universal stress protein [Pontibacter sp. KCTC 32443]|uniref:universal stress protein n=1 Tax=Pontibacter TaxID=323449 RepID=UPI00164E43B5|nr:MULTISPECIES: universal stress protein [Pontibacter]MBC5775319.1 universal stress protein [Pontibacter sp. KCTC 32443]